MKSLLIPTLPSFELGGAKVYKALLDRTAQTDLVQTLREVVAVAPLFSPKTAYGKPMSVRMTSAGRFGWVSNSQGYRYQENHPLGVRWPEIPAQVLDIWHGLVGTKRLPESCLINFYGKNTRMGMHQDKDEADFSQPVVSISLGDDALFRIGGTRRGGSTLAHWLESGDVLVFGGTARLAYHGIDRIRFGSSTILKQGGRINVTLRVVT